MIGYERMQLLLASFCTILSMWLSSSWLQDGNCPSMHLVRIPGMKKEEEKTQVSTEFFLCNWPEHCHMATLSWKEDCKIKYLVFVTSREESNKRELGCGEWDSQPTDTVRLLRTVKGYILIGKYYPNTKTWKRQYKKTTDPGPSKTSPQYADKILADWIQQYIKIIIHHSQLRFIQECNIDLIFENYSVKHTTLTV